MGTVVANRVPERENASRLGGAETLEKEGFYATLEASLRSGNFRLVLVLDQAPEDLVRLVGYLEEVTDGLSIDLVTVAAYDIGERRIVVPQRIDPGRPQAEEVPGQPAITQRKGQLEPGTDAFRAQIVTAPEEHRHLLEMFATWANQIARERLAEVSTNLSQSGVIILPRLLPERAGLVTLWRSTDGTPSIQLWRSVFERRAPRSLQTVEAQLGKNIGQGTVVTHVTTSLMDMLHDAYREANGVHD